MSTILIKDGAGNEKFYEVDGAGTSIDPHVQLSRITDGTNKVSVNSDGQLYVSLDGGVNDANSSATPLGIGGVFTGTSVDISEVAVIIVAVYSDVISATDGLEVQFSTDNTNWDHTDCYTIAGGTGKTFSFQPTAKYMRILYTNGGTGQTDFRLQTSLKKAYVKPSSHRVADSLSSQDDAELVKSVLSGKGPDDIFRNVNTTIDGNLLVVDNSNGLAISEGDVTGKSFVHKFGQAPDFDTSDGEVNIRDGSDDASINQMVYVWSTTAAIDTISSSSAADTQEVKIQGLDSDFNLIEQTVTLNGQNKVTLGTPLIRAFRGKNHGFTAFSGIVYLYEDTAIVAGVPTDTTKLRLAINDGNNQTLMALFTIPNGKTGYMRDWYASTAGASKDSQYIIRLWAREYDETSSQHKTRQLKHISSLSDIGTSYIQHKYGEPEKFITKVDLMMTAESTAGGASGCSIGAGFDIVLVDD